MDESMKMDQLNMAVKGAYWIKNSPCASFWIKNAYEQLRGRDIVDALKDVELLAEVLRAEFELSLTAIQRRIKNADQ